MANDTILTAARLRELLHYDRETGQFTWLSTGSGRRLNRSAGAQELVKPRYSRIHITVDYHQYKAHRLAWLWMTGEWPDGDMDHINQNPLDNRWTNLRVVTKADNNRNRVKKFIWTKKPPGRARRILQE